MGRSILHSLIIGLSAAVLVSASVQNTSAEETSAATAEIGKKKQRAFPFHGKIASTDKEALTITLAGKEKTRTIVVTAQTKIQKAGKPATFTDALVGEEIGGTLQKRDDGKEEAVTLRLGAKTVDPATAPTTAQK